MDNIKVFAIVFVIGLHVSAYGVSTEFHQVLGANKNWWICNFFESIFRCCVPLFIMLTGALLLQRTMPLRSFLKRRFSRILIPTTFWGNVYLIYNALLISKSPGKLNSHNLSSWVINQFLEGPIFSFWYVYMLVGLYLVIPVLQPWVLSASNKAILYFLCIWLITLFIKQFNVIPEQSPLELRYFSGYIGYLLLGYYLAHRLPVTNIIKLVSVLLVIAGFAITFAGTYLLSLKNHVFSSDYYDYLSVNVLISSIGMFLLLKSTNTSVDKFIPLKIKSTLIRFGFGIYLIHPLPLMFMVHFKIDYKVINPVAAIPVVTLICLTISCLIAWVISKLPFGKFVVE